jgi:hypothetical protein
VSDAGLHGEKRMVSKPLAAVIAYAESPYCTLHNQCCLKVNGCFRFFKQKEKMK